MSMANSVAADAATRISTEAARIFVEAYYSALSSARKTLASYYTPSSMMPDGKSLPIIVFNGNSIPSPAALQDIYQSQMPQAHYEVQDYDCQVVNPHYVAEGAQARTGEGRNMTILITTNGYVRYGGPREPMRGFSESFVLVPNHGAGRSRNAGKDWLIQSQNFRLVV